MRFSRLKRKIKIEKSEKQKIDLLKKLEEKNQKELSECLKKNGINTVKDFENLFEENIVFEKTEN